MKKINYNHEYLDRILVGIDLLSLISSDTLEAILKEKKLGKSHLEQIKRTIDSIKTNNNKVYILLHDISDILSKNKKCLDKIRRILKKIGIDDPIVFYGNDLIGVCREYRFDVVCTQNRTIDDSKVDTISKNILAKRFHNKIPETLNITDCIPEYMQVILMGNNEDDKAYYINHIYQLADKIEDCKQNIIDRISRIYKSYEYIPKTGIVSIDKEYKKYWLASKFENNIVDEVTQKLSRFDFLKYHNRFQPLEEIIYLPKEDLEIKITKEKRNQIVEQACKAFLAQGLKKGDVVTVCAPNSLSDYVLSTALNHIGVIVNPLHPLATTDKVERYLKETNPKMFIYFDLESEDETVDMDYLIEKYNLTKVVKLSPVDMANPIIKKLYDIQVKQKKKKNQYHPRFRLSNQEKCLTFDELLKYGNTYIGSIDVEHSPTDTAYYYSTGGTTSGKPSIVDLPYSMINSAYYNSYGIDIEKGDAVFINYPRYIAFSDENCTHLPDSLGMKLILSPYEYPSNFGKILQKYKIKVLQMAPQFYEMMLEDEKNRGFDDIDLSSLKYIVAGGDKMDDNLKRRILDMFARHNNTAVQIIIGYGCTEVAGSSFVQLFDTNRNAQEGNIGIPLPIFDVKLIDEENQEVMDKIQKGRLLVGGQGYIMNGYLNDEQTTKEVLVSDTESRMWYDTADIVEFVPDNNVNGLIPNATANFITREKRFIMITRANCSGKAIPDSIEKLIVDTIEGVRQCCVVGVKENDEVVLKAAVTLEDGYQFTEEMSEQIKLVSSAKDILNTLSEVKYIEEMPLTDRQKVKYLAIEEMFQKEIEEKTKVKTLQ